jgi:two-component system KDP operon response regulator KdpE
MRRKKALLVEDEESWSDLLTVVLSDAHFTPMRATTAHDAIKLAKKSKPDIVILDLGLPDGSGVSLLEALHDLPGCSRLPVVVLSAYHKEEVGDVDLGDAVFLSKDQGLPPLLAAIGANK